MSETPTTVSTSAPGAQAPTAVTAGADLCERDILLGLLPDAARCASAQCLTDLNLDQVIASICGEADEHGCANLYRTPLTDPDAIRYRQDVFRDLEREDLHDSARRFVDRIDVVRRHLRHAAELDHPLRAEAWRLEAASAYCEAVTRLAEDLARFGPNSEGLRALSRYLADYTTSTGFRSLSEQASDAVRALGRVTYAVRIAGNRVTVSRYAGEADYSAEVLETFARFRQRAVEARPMRTRLRHGLTHVEERILERVALLFPGPFESLARFVRLHADFIDPEIAAADRGFRFYLAYLDHVRPLRAAGLSLCYPAVSDRDKSERVRDAYDLALADKQVAEGAAVVPNDYALSGQERVIVVTGPNQGGKTTFARMFGQLHHLAALGCPVPGTEARLFVPDRVLTHFEREEDMRDAVGKLEDDLLRMRTALAQASAQSVFVLNEIFTSTSARDAAFLGEELLREIAGLGALCVYVTFIDELASLGPWVVSMTSTVPEEHPEERTYKIVRRPADGRAYALALAKRHGLTYERLKGSIRR